MGRMLTFLILLFTLSSCSEQSQPPITISTNSWIGYSPLFYAREMGWLDELEIDLVNVVSLAESKQLYESGIADAFVGTQYEFGLARIKTPSLTPLILFDRSNGGDMIFSNLTLSELKDNRAKITAYLEVESVNSVVLDDFLHQNDINQTLVHRVNSDPAATEAKAKALIEKKEPFLIVTYSPYNLSLHKRGLKEVANTREGMTIVVVDALYASRELADQNRDRFKRLKHRLQEAIEVSRSDPELYYQQVKFYLGDPSYDEFLGMLGQIKWIIEDRALPFDHKMQSMQFPIAELL